MGNGTRARILGTFIKQLCFLTVQVRMRRRGEGRGEKKAEWEKWKLNFCSRRKKNFAFFFPSSFSSSIRGFFSGREEEEEDTFFMTLRRKGRREDDEQKLGMQQPFPPLPLPSLLDIKETPTSDASWPPVWPYLAWQHLWVWKVLGVLFLQGYAYWLVLFLCVWAKTRTPCWKMSHVPLAERWQH